MLWHAPSQSSPPGVQEHGVRQGVFADSQIESQHECLVLVQLPCCEGCDALRLLPQLLGLLMLGFPEPLFFSLLRFMIPTLGLIAPQGVSSCLEGWQRILKSTSSQQETNMHHTEVLAKSEEGGKEKCHKPQQAPWATMSVSCTPES